MGEGREGEADSLTRRFVTPQGDVTYAELADLIAPHIEDLLDRIADGEFSRRPFDELLVLQFHREIIGDVLPEIAGRWRSEPVQVGAHVPPEYFHVPIRMREYVGNVEARLRYASTFEDQIELLAYAEGEFLHVHPFSDFNGRAVRILLNELLGRLDFPPVEVSVVRGTPKFRSYQNALAHYDNGRIDALVDFWVGRVAGGVPG